MFITRLVRMGAVLVAAGTASLALPVLAHDGACHCVVTNVSDAGEGSLRHAIDDANLTPGADVITFAIDGPGPHTIALASALPAITDGVEIDGMSEPDYAGAPVVIVDGSGVGSGDGFDVQADGTVIKGLSISGFDDGVHIAANGVTIIANDITGNSGSGVAVATGTGDRIIANSIHGNGLLGIDLGDDGVTANDAGDADAGPNGLQNHPVLDAAVISASGSSVDGTLTSAPNTDYRIEVYQSPSADPTGFGEGLEFRVYATVTTDAAGLATFNFKWAGGKNPGNWSGQLNPGFAVTATATGPDGTSEFSEAETVSQSDKTPSVFIVRNTKDSGQGSLRKAIEDANENLAPDTIVFDLKGSAPHVISLSSALPAIDDPVLIDGWSEDDFVDVPVVVLDGSGTSGAVGFEVLVHDTSIRGLEITGFDTAVLVEGDRVNVEGNVISSNATGLATTSNASEGLVTLNTFSDNGVGISAGGTANVVSDNAIQFNAVGASVSGADVVTDNTIDGNTTGVEMPGAGASILGNSITGNDVGLSITGTGNTVAASTITSGGTGVAVNGGASGNALTGVTIASNTGDGVAIIESHNNAVSGSTISGNGGAGVFIDPSSGNVIDGSVITGNVGDGVAIVDSDSNTVSGNTIADNGGVGVRLDNADNNEVTGNTITGNATGIAIVASVGNLVENNDVYGNAGNGVSIDGGASNNVLSNLIGSTDTATLDANGGNGLYLTGIAVNNVIGQFGLGNTVAKNGGHGVLLDTASGFTVQLNNVNSNLGDGIALTGASADNTFAGNSVAANAGAGISLTDGPTNNVVGSSNVVMLNSVGIAVVGVSTAGNTISGNTVSNNTGDGIVAVGAGSNTVGGNALTGNAVGVSIDGSDGLSVNDNVIEGNGVGVAVLGGTANIVALNTISLNTTGVAIAASATGNTVSDNTIASSTGIGVEVAGSTNLVSGNEITGNATGVSVVTGGDGNTISSNNISSNTGHGVSIDGSNSEVAGNNVHNNGGDGVRVSDAAATGNVITLNSINGNAGLGIDLGGDGVTANDALDADGGANGLQNFPTLNYAATDAGATVTIIDGVLNGAPETDVTVELFVSSSPDASGNGEGDLWVETFQGTTDVDGNFSFSGELGSVLAIGDWLSATATTADGTSEFSLAIEIVELVPPVLSVGVEADVSSAGAGALAVPIESIPIERIRALSGLLASTPISAIEIEDSPISAIPISAIPISAIPISAIPISAIPISAIGGWGDVLADTELGGVPLQTVTLQDVLELDPPVDVDLTLGDSGLSSTSLGSTSLTSILLGATPISAIPVPDGYGTWCEFFESIGLNCSDFNLTTDSILSLDVQAAPISAIPISAIPISAIPISAIPISAIPISAIPISAIELVDAPISAIPISAIDAGFIGDCPDCTTLGDALVTDGGIVNLAVIDELLDMLVGFDIASTPISAIPISAIPISAIPISAIPISAIPISAIEVDCDLVDCETATFGDAVANEAVEGEITLDVLLSILFNTPISSTPISAIPISAIPISAIPISAIPISAIPISAIPISAIPISAIDLPEGYSDWCEFLNAFDPTLCGALGVTSETTLEELAALISALLAAGDLTEDPLGDVFIDGILPTSTTLDVLDLNETSLAAVEIEGAPISAIPISAIDLAASPISAIPISAIPISAIDVDCTLVDCDNGTFGDAVEQGALDGSLDIAALLAAILNIDVASTPISAIPISAIPISAIPISAIPISAIPISAIEIVDAPISAIPISAIDPGFIGDCPDCTTLGDAIIEDGVVDLYLIEELLDMLVGFEISSTPISAIPISAIDIAGTPISAIPISAIPISAIEVDCTLVNCADGTLGDAVANDAITGELSVIDLLRALFGTSINAAPISAIPISAIPISAIELVVDCGIVDCEDPLLTLADVLAADALIDGATLADVLLLGLNSVFGIVTNLDLSPEDVEFFLSVFYGGQDVGGVVGDENISLGNLTIGDILLAIFLRSDFPWEDVPLDQIGVTEFAGTGETINYTIEAGNDVDGGAALSPYVSLTLPAGFFPAPGATVAYCLDGVCDAPFGLEPAFENGTATWTLPSLLLNGASVSINAPAFPGLKLGIQTVSAEVGALGASPATASNQAPVSITEHLEDENDVPEGAPIADADVLYISHIGSPNDDDFFRIPIPVLPGTLISVFLSNLNAEGDLVMYRPTDGSSTDSQRPIVPVDDEAIGASGSGGELDPDTLRDIEFADLPIVSVSTNRGESDESVSTAALEGESGYYTIHVSGFDGAFSEDPYVLRVKVRQAEPEVSCPARVFPFAEGIAGALPPTPTAGVNTLFLVNQERMAKFYGQAAADEVMAKLNELATYDFANGEDVLGVNGVVIPVEGDPAVAAAYDAWDADPCSTVAANNVATAIDELIEGLAPAGLRSVVLVGSDELIPMMRVPDLTRLSNQADYAGDVSFAGPNALSSAFLTRHVLTDNIYGDFDPVRWLDHLLYVPDVGIGRMVETPDEIIGALERFIVYDGRLDPSTALSTGYDFLTDGALAVADALEQAIPNPDLSVMLLIDRDPITGEFTINWSRLDLMDALNISPDSVLPTPELVSLNAHFDHYRALPADEGTLFTSADLPAVDPLAPAFAGRVVFSMGCNSGVSFADVLISDPVAAQAFEERLNDWPQAFAQQGAAAFAGNTGYGYGDTKTVALTERLMELFAKRLDGSMLIGQAHSEAKNEYFATAGLYGVYDEKVISEATFYGLPMYRIGSGTPSQGPAHADLETGPDPVTQLTTASLVINPLFELNTTDDGQYYSADDGVLYTHLRPIQPKVDVNVGLAGLIAHGAVITSATSTDITEFDAAFARPVIDLSSNEPEPESGGVIFPTSFVNIASYNTINGRTDLLNVVPGQFRSDFGLLTGTQRLFESMNVDVYYTPDDDDLVPPVIHQADAVLFNGQASFIVRTTDEAPGEVIRVLVLYQEIGGTEWSSIDLVKSASGDVWTGGVPVTASKIDYLVQSVDSSGNVGAASNKGIYFEAAPPQLGGPSPYEFTFDGTAGNNDWFVSDVLVTIGGVDADVITEVSVDAGPFELLDGPILLTEDGVHPISVRGSDGSTGIAYVALDKTPPIVEVPIPADGAIYLLNEVATADYFCLDAGSGIVSCDGTVAPGSPIDTSTAGDKTFTVTGVDSAGLETTVTHTYHVHYDVTGPKSPIVLPPGVNEEQAGSGVPVKWEIADVNGEQIFDLATVVEIRSTDLDSGDTIFPLEEKGKSELRYGNQHYIFDWATNKKWKGTTRDLVITLDSGQQLIAIFAFK